MLYFAADIIDNLIWAPSATEKVGPDHVPRSLPSLPFTQAS